MKKCTYAKLVSIDCNAVCNLEETRIKIGENQEKLIAKHVIVKSYKAAFESK